MPPSYAYTLYADSTSPDKRVLVLPGDRHGEGFHQANEQYEAAVAEFLSRISAGTLRGAELLAPPQSVPNTFNNLSEGDSLAELKLRPPEARTELFSISLCSRLESRQGLKGMRAGGDWKERMTYAKARDPS